MKFKEQVARTSVRFHHHALGPALVEVDEKVTPTRRFFPPAKAGVSLPALEYFRSEGFISKCGLSVTVETVGGQDASAEEDHALPSAPKLSPPPQNSTIL